MAVQRDLTVLCAVLASSAALPSAGLMQEDLGRQRLSANDGWAASGSGTTGGALAAPNQVYVVRNRSELIAALNNGVRHSVSPGTPSNEPKIIYIEGVIDANVDDDNRSLACPDYCRDGYTPEAYVDAFEPAKVGRSAPTGPLEDARIASRNAQRERIRIRVGSNTTIVGRGPSATLRGAWLDIRGNGGGNIIVRNLTFQETYDCFPEWSPTDGARGAWNAEYDSISIREVTHVWIDHNAFEDTSDPRAVSRFGVPYQVHDGLVDITNGADFVTVSWNRFANHDKGVLIGASDAALTDRDRLRVTVHHNMFDDIVQRAPRVRFGQVHVYNNYYRLGTPYEYSWGVGVESDIVAEQNYFEAASHIDAARLVRRFNGSRLRATGTMLNSDGAEAAVDVLAEYNKANDPDLNADGPVPSGPSPAISPARSVPAIVAAGAGPQR